MLMLIFPIICGIICLKMFNQVQKLYEDLPKTCVWRKICLVADILLALPILVYPYTLIADIMMFDSPGSENNPRIWMLFLLMSFYPLPLMLLMWLITFISKKMARVKTDDKISE